MRCCFCGTELENDLNMWDAPTDFWYCPNEKCVAPEQDINVKVWQALIDGKKAQDVLNRIERILLLDSEKPMTLTPAGKKEIIASITKGDKE